MPTYNCAKYIPEAIDSVLNQGCNDLELIIVDDGSTDDTRKVISSYVGRKCVTYICQHNQGVSAARNRGIQAAKGCYIAFLDSDDLWLPNKLEKQLAFFDRYPEVGFLVSDEEYFSGDSVLFESYLSHSLLKAKLPDTPSKLRFPLTLLFTHSFVSTSSVIVTRECINKAGFFDESLNIVEDRDMWIRLAMISPMGLIPEVLVRKRQFHGSNISDVDRKILAISLFKVLTRYEKACSALIAKEGSELKSILSKAFYYLGKQMWYADEIELSQKFFFSSFKRAGFNALPWFLLTMLGKKNIAIIRKIKAQLKTEGFKLQ
ncbi:MAG: glycosyltransferase [Deltaproteobacteria bacterium]|nr:glycosyltransferase [Deltaproteobacteria bacterium]